MPLQFAHIPPVADESRGRCFGCFRPRRDCYCNSIPTIDNRTEVLIVQHRRERSHRFNTARIVHRALANSTLLVDHTAQLAERLRLKPGAALLYPGDDAQLLSDISAEARPAQLVILDGTWHHARTLIRDVPALRALPRLRLAPAAPSRYRIRREPSDEALSTVEAIIAALATLEPETAGVSQLMIAFDQMVERQLAHPKAEYGWRKNTRRRRGCGNIPAAIVHDLANVVVAYGESAAGAQGAGRSTKPPVYWVAQRIGGGDLFRCAVQSSAPLTDTLLAHLELSRADFGDAVALEEAQRRWRQFLRPTDTVAVYNQGTMRLLAQLASSATRASKPALLLKSIEVDRLRPYGTLEEVVAGEGLTPEPPLHPGRAGRRLANAVTLVRHLSALGAAAY